MSIYIHTHKMNFLVAQRVKHLPTMRETWVGSLDQGDPLEKEMATHSSILAWKIPWTEEPSRLQPMGLQRVEDDFTFTFTFTLYTHKQNQNSPVKIKYRLTRWTKETKNYIYQKKTIKIQTGKQNKNKVPIENKAMKIKLTNMLRVKGRKKRKKE